jgi:hypothetical protein
MEERKKEGHVTGSIVIRSSTWGTYRNRATA